MSLPFTPYSPYTDRIKKIINTGRNKKNLEKFTGTDSKSSGSRTVKKEAIQEQRNFNKKNQLNAGEPLGSILNITSLEKAQLGLHPDFKHLKGTDETEFHYIVSVFIDIAGSTNLFRGYDLDEIYQITNTIQGAAIHTCLALGGQVQRLQGDGVFAYFGGRGIDKKIASEMALMATSMFTYFVKNDLRDVFAGDEIEDIKTRIGIDFGDDDDVMWANFGLMDVNELTTLSLHTSLASKMQANAKENGIVVGQNVKDQLQIDESLFDLVKNSKGEVEQRYIFEDRKKNFRYTQYAFDWYQYLKSLPFIVNDNEGNLLIRSKSETERLSALRHTTSLLEAGTAYTNTSGSISSNNTGVKNEEHKFHYGKQIF